MSDYEYIRRDETLSELLNMKFLRDDDGFAMVYWSDIVDRITAIPAEEVEPIVHCRDCVHCEKETMTCTIFIKNRLGDDFCSEGER